MKRGTWPMRFTREFWIALGYRGVGVAVTSVFGLLVGLYCAETKSIATAATLVVVYLIGLFFYIGVEQYRRFNQADVVKKSERVLQESQRSQLTREGELLCTASEKVAELLKDIAYRYTEVAGAQVLDWDAGNTGWVYKQKRMILQCICDILNRDRREFKGPSDYFKATLFKVVAPDALALDCSYYPPGREPRTERIDRSRHPNATAFRCLDSEAMQVIQNVPRELQSGEQSRWVELWTGQGQHYASMVCTPICIGERATHTFQVVSILTIDTNRADYFSDREEDQNFLARLVAPFRAELSFIYGATTPTSKTREGQSGNSAG